MKTLILTTLILVSIISYSQNVDYLHVRDSLTNLSCGDMNYDDVVHSRTNLENFDPSCIQLNKSEYYRNLGFSYYLSFAKTIDSNFLEKAIIAYTNAIESDSNSYVSMWDLSLCYFFIHEYELGLFMLDRYKIKVPPAYFSPKEYRVYQRYFIKNLRKE